MKWDLLTVSSLYILAIARYHNQEGEITPRRIRSMRDLRRGDLSWLKKLRREASKIVKERWSLGEGSVRCFIHYQPSYCEFRVTNLLIILSSLILLFLADPNELFPQIIFTFISRMRPTWA